MGLAHSANHLGEPALTVAVFQLWVHGRELPEARGDDGNWLRVTAHCGASGASVWVSGSILMVTDIDRFGRECQGIYDGRATSASLEPCEPEVRVDLKVMDRLGHVEASVAITPDNLHQSHRMNFEIDQSYLPAIVRECATILREYPVRGDSGGGD